MGRLRRLHALILACLAAGAFACAAGPAAASENQETILQDDPHIVFPPSLESLDNTLLRVKSLGVDRIRVSVFWHLVAPRPQSKRKPDWGPRGGRDPANYPKDGWDRYDRIVKLAQRHGLTVLMTLTGSAPAWASGTKQRKESYYRPSATEFRDFAEAVGRRYSGAYPDDDAPPVQPEPQPDPVPVPVPGQTQTETQPRPAPLPPLPRVSAWSLWNEPNFPTWLSPQRTRFGRRGIVPKAPALYRQLVAASHSGLNASGHGRDLILLGETAPRGGAAKSTSLNKTMLPLPFIRELYCLTPSYRPYRGRQAKRRACPQGAASRRRFVARNPGLFRASGWAHHPYSLDQRPTWKYPHKDAVTLGSMRRMAAVLDRVHRRWGVRRRLPLWITEYGYQTRPPEPFKGVSPGRQASWTSWAEAIAFRSPRIASFAQFLLVDDRPHQTFKGRKRWVTWQSGLLDWDLEQKPAYREFRHPINVSPTNVRRRGRVRLFAAYRPAEGGAIIPARIQYRRSGGDWRTVRSLNVVNDRGYLSARVRIPASGLLRVLWSDPENGDDIATRAVGVRTRR